VESSVSLSWCIRQGTRGEGDGDADYLPPHDCVDRCQHPAVKQSHQSRRSETFIDYVKKLFLLATTSACRASHTLVHVMISCRVDCCNSLLYSACVLAKLQYRNKLFTLHSPEGDRINNTVCLQMLHTVINGKNKQLTKNRIHLIIKITLETKHDLRLV